MSSSASDSSRKRRVSTHESIVRDHPENRQNNRDITYDSSGAAKSPDRKRGRSSHGRKGGGVDLLANSSVAAAAAAESTYQGHIATSLNGLSIDFKPISDTPRVGMMEEEEPDSKKRRRHVVSPGRSNRHTQKSRRSHGPEEVDSCPGSHYRDINSVLREAHFEGRWKRMLERKEDRDAKGCDCLEGASLASFGMGGGRSKGGSSVQADQAANAKSK